MTKTGTDSQGNKWAVTLDADEMITITAIDHDGDADQLSRYDEEALMDLVLPIDSDEDGQLDPRDALYDRARDIYEDRVCGLA